VKRILVYAPILALVAVVISCASAPLPPPEQPSDSLIIGAFALDYPDGFFQFPAEKISRGITLTFVNKTTGARFDLLTATDGTFSFLSNGSDSYELVHYYWKENDPNRPFVYTLQNDLKYSFQPIPHVVYYLGHHSIVFVHPGKQETRQLGSKRDLAVEFIRSTAPESEWLTYEVAVPDALVQQ
jgi:hypothetical protein